MIKTKKSGAVGTGAKKDRKAGPSPAIIDKLAPTDQDYQMSLEREITGDDSLKVVTFLLGDREYAVEVAFAEEVVKPRKFATLPRMPQFVRGVVSLRGEMVLLIDLKRRLDLGEAAVDAGKVLIVETEGLKAGLAVDAMAGLLELPPGALKGPGKKKTGLGPDFIKGTLKSGKRSIVLLDTDKVLDLPTLRGEQEA